MGVGSGAETGKKGLIYLSVSDTVWCILTHFVKNFTLAGQFLEIHCPPPEGKLP